MTTDQAPPTPTSRGRVTDARGRRVTQLDPVAMHILHQYDLIDRDALPAIADEIGFGIPRWRMRIGYACWTLGLLYCAVVVILKFTLGFKFLSIVGLAWLINGFIIAIGIFFTWHGARRARFDRVLAVLLKYSRCPHCGYDLTGLPYDANDGATICPECGCAWKLNPIDQNNHSDDH